MLLRDDILRVTDKYGLVQIQTQPGPTEDNALLFTSEYYTILCVRRELTEFSRLRFETVVRKCQIVPGLFKRYVDDTHPAQEGPDDYIGLITAACLLRSSIAEEIYQYGRKSKQYLLLRYWFNNEKPGTRYYRDGKRLNWSAWLGRLPAFVAHLHFATGRMPPLVYRMAWALTVAFSGRDVTDTDSRILSWLLIQAMRRRSLLCNLAVKHFYKRLAKDYPTGMQGVFAYYFGKEHPLAQYRID